MHNAIQETTQLHCPTVPDWTWRENWTIYIYSHISQINQLDTHTHYPAHCFTKKGMERTHKKQLFLSSFVVFIVFSPYIHAGVGPWISSSRVNCPLSSLSILPSGKDDAGIAMDWWIRIHFFCPGVRRFCLICIQYTCTRNWFLDIVNVV